MYKEHLKAPSPILSTRTTLATQHLWKLLRIIGREGNNMATAIKEAIYISVNNSTLNRNVLHSIPELKINK